MQNFDDLFYVGERMSYEGKFNSGWESGNSGWASTFPHRTFSLPHKKRSPDLGKSKESGWRRISTINPWE